MRYLLLPLHLLRFWYLESLVTFVTTWKNLISYLEEDLAVGLMVKLLFVPLFHDSTIVGRILSFLFRITRITFGLLAFIVVSILLLAGAIFWFVMPIFYPKLIVIGIGFFLIHFLTHPEKKVWKNKDSFWDSSLISKKKVTIENLFKNREVLNLINNLEVTTLPKIEILDVEQVGKLAFELAKKTASPYISARHFFVAVVKLTPEIETSLLKQNLKVGDFEQALHYLEKKKNLWRIVWIWEPDFAIHHLRGINRGWLGVPTPALDSVSIDLTREAAKGKFPTYFGRSAVISEIVNILSTDNRRNVLLVGSAGTGKTSLIQYLAAQILKGDAPLTLATKRIVSLDTTRLLSSMTTEGDMAERIKNVFDEVAFAGNIILVLEEIQDLGNSYNLMSKYLDSSDFQFIATTEPENYVKTLDNNGSFARLFTKIEIPPATESETVQILEERVITLERKKKIIVSFMSLKKAAELGQLIQDRVLPDSAIGLIEEAVVSIKKGAWLTSKQVETEVSKRSNIPIGEVAENNKKELLDLEKTIHQKLIDQVEAVKAISDSLRRSATGLREDSRPIGSFLFVGPTGVGKTELAKILSEVYFKDKDAFARFDMSEYQTTEQLLDHITEAVHKKPYSLLLLDEFEKADPKVLTLFLQVLDDGRLTDSSGRTVDFTNTIIIATSNVGSLIIADGLKRGHSLTDLDQQVNDEILKTFRPELVNRFDDVILFKPLSQEDLEKIVTLKLDSLKVTMKEKGYLIEFDEALTSELARRGFDPVLGARPLRRLIQDTLESNLSKIILGNKLQKGETFTVGVEFLNG